MAPEDQQVGRHSYQPPPHAGWGAAYELGVAVLGQRVAVYLEREDFMLCLGAQRVRSSRRA